MTSGTYINKSSHQVFSSVLYLLVFFSGFANLATEIIGPRLVASIFGYTTTIWAIIIAVTLLGISVGYYIGGRVAQNKIISWLPIILIINALWLLAISWIIWELPAQLVELGIGVVMLTAFAAFFVPATLFSMTSPLAISLFSTSQTSDQIPRTVGNVYALSTVGSVLGALLAAYVFIPWVGLSLSLRSFAVILILFALYFLNLRWRIPSTLLLLAALVVPQPSFHWQTDMQLLAQREGNYQTIRVYYHDPFLEFFLGPISQSMIDTTSGEPALDYSRVISEIIQDVKGKSVLVIGAAGHSHAHVLERRGASVTEVEIDPFVASISDEFFGKIKGKTIIQDGRAFVELAPPSSYDIVIVDAYNALSVPPQLTTREFFDRVKQILKPNGKLIVNYIGIIQGPQAKAYHAMAATISSVFTDTRVLFVYGEKFPSAQNILFFASMAPQNDLQLIQAPHTGVVLTDDLNPIEIFYEETLRGEVILQR